MTSLSLAPTPLRGADKRGWLQPLSASYYPQLAGEFARGLEQLRCNRKANAAALSAVLSGYAAAFAHFQRDIDRLRPQLEGVSGSTAYEVCAKVHAKGDEVSVWANDRLQRESLENEQEVAEVAKEERHLLTLSSVDLWTSSARIWMVQLDRVSGTTAELHRMQEHCVCQVCHRGPTVTATGLVSKSNKKFVRLQCQHVLHLPCLVGVLKSRATCPSCSENVFGAAKAGGKAPSSPEPRAKESEDAEGAEDAEDAEESEDAEDAEGAEESDSD